MSKRRSGDTKSLRPPEGETWTWQTNAMLGSITFRSLGIHARRILDFLLYEHAAHAGRQNGDLGATYKQLRAWGVTGDDIRIGLQELYVCGFVQLTHQGPRQAGGGDHSRYALTWLPTLAGTSGGKPPTHEWREVLRRLSKDGIGTVRAAKVWLKAEVGPLKRAYRLGLKHEPTPQVRLVSLLNCGARSA